MHEPSATALAGSESRILLDSLERARGGCTTSLGVVLDSTREYLLLVARQHARNGIQAKCGISDLVQETFLEAHRDFHSFDGTSLSEWRAWLKRILLNNAATVDRHYRRTKKRTVNRELAIVGDLGMADEARTPLSKMILGEESAHLLVALQQLPEDYQRVIRLRHRDHFTFEEIGDCLGRSSEAARKLWSRAVDALAQRMSESDL